MLTNMNNKEPDVLEVKTLEYLITHIFCPLKLPDGDDHSLDNDGALSRVTLSATCDFSQRISGSASAQWQYIVKMLQNLDRVMSSNALDEALVDYQIQAMEVGDVLVYLIRAQNAAVMFRKQPEETLVESFEVSPCTEAVMGAAGKLVCSYPGPVIAVPNHLLDGASFRAELANFLSKMDKDVLAACTTRKAGSEVVEERDTAHPRYITELLTGILRAVGRPAEVKRISKRIGDDVVWKDSKLPWRRSPLWLVIRVAMQTTLDRNGLGRNAYKTFMLFFMNDLAHQAQLHDMSNDVLQWTSAKISCRLTKLAVEAPEWLSEAVLETCTVIRALLNERWTQVQAEEAISPMWNPSALDFSADTKLTLFGSSPYIHNALQTQHSASPPSKFQPKNCLRGTLEDFLSADRTFFQRAYDEEPYVTLYDLEREVRKKIDGWVAHISESAIDGACERLELLANSYSSAAMRSYEGNPEDLSRMLLTIVELWIALDKLVVQQIPILRDYSPEIPISLLERLLLRDPSHLQRLPLAVGYIRQRACNAQDGYSVFSDIVDERNFSVRYFDQSPRLQSLEERILGDARSEREAKRQELARANEHHKGLREKASNTNHIYTTNQYGQPRDHYKWSCPRCIIDDEMKRMKIAIHEWPLPTNPQRVKRVVFELDCPISFNMWRSAIFHLLVDLCSPSVGHVSPYLLQNYSGLQGYYVGHSRSRITLASDTKPFVQSHYRETAIPSEESKVCVNNGLTFHGFDKTASTKACTAFNACDISSLCTYQLPLGPYQNLRRYLKDTTHTSNEVLCDQANCHKDLSIHEFIAFGHLRSGPSLQWLNMLREVRANTLRFRHDETHFLFAQASCQVGPVSEARKLVWHDELCGSSFRHTFLKELECLVKTISGNWLEAMTMASVAFLVARILASNIADHDSTPDSQALNLLDVVREKTFSWVLELSKKLEDASEAEREILRGQLRDAAAICRSTFEVGLANSAKQLLSSPRSLEILLSCAIIIHNNTPAKLDDLSTTSRLLISRDRRLAWKLEHMVSNTIEERSEGIHFAIRHVWPAYREGDQWAGLEDCSWFASNTSASPDEQSQEISLNILDGTLLVNGKPLGRLPLNIQKDPLFTTIFGGQVLEVVPADMIGMEYATRGFISEHLVYFRMAGSELVIKIKKREDSDILQLIPPNKLASDLPRVLIQNHVHWLNLSTRSIEIRPFSSLWRSSNDNWRIQFEPLGGHSMTNGQSFLFDIRSPTWQMLSKLLQPLQDSQDLVVTQDDHSTVSVELPRCGLSFFINSDGELESRHPRGMVYDKDQSIGTLFGLVNKLVLRPKDNLAEGLVQRQVLIPEGKVRYCSHDHHVEVTVCIKGPANRSISYQTFRIDTDLGRLVGHSRLTSNLYRAYLHALCSNPCSVDPLTGKTGTEEALTILRSAAVRSFLKFDKRAARLLECIASLTTERVWYPLHLRCMQTVHWTDLPSASQHHDLYLACLSIKIFQKTLRDFHEGASTLAASETFPTRNNHLLRRIGLRAVLLDPPEFRNAPDEDHDDTYEARDILQTSSDEARAYGIACAVSSWSPTMPRVTNIRQFLESWGQQLEGATTQTVSLQYSREWLSLEPRLIWLSLYDACRNCRRDGHHNQLLFTLPAMAYASPGLEEVALTLLSFATVSQFEDVSPPLYAAYRLVDGYEPSSTKLHGCITSNATRYRDSPESSSQDYGHRLQRDSGTLHDRTMARWPCRTPPPLHYFLNTSLYNIERLSSDVGQLLESCYQNQELKQHLDRVQQILDQGHTVSRQSSVYSFVPSSPSSLPSNQHLALLEHLFRRQPPIASLTLHLVTASTGSCTAGSEELGRLVDDFRRHGKNSFHAKYADDLHLSKNHLVNDRVTFSPGSLARCTDLLKAHYDRCRLAYAEDLLVLADRFTPQTRSERAVSESGQWPRITVRDLLGCLASKSNVAVPPDWRDYLMSFTKLALEYQRSRRLLLLATNGQLEDLCKEMENTGCIGWDAESHPDWLLIQLEGNFLIRRIQTNVAFEMISPQSGKNTTLQLHMGEGKSSVIVPMTASELSDGQKLVRVVVPKALTVQMFHILVDRLGGLTNRRIYHLPFSRSLQINHDVLYNILRECTLERGILVVQPDHILSLKLLSVEKQLQGGQGEDASRLLQTQRWLHSHARDILDESDEILHVRNQLVYTIDSQRPLEGFPYRWTTAQQILTLVRKHAAALHSRFPLKVEYEDRKHGAFPHIRLLHPDAGSELVHLIAQDIMGGQLADLNLTQASQDVKDTFHIFITLTDVKESDVQMVQEYSRGTSMWMRILHLRGLLASGILSFALTERRWRVGFGLAPSRTMLAVPYRAKDVPAPRAEFGHPDVAVVLTCLSYYYQGLDQNQLMTCFELLLQLDNPDLEYELWVRDWPTAPEYLRQVSGINIKSLEQWNEYLLPVFSCNQATIDFYLSRVVFPKEAKEFLFKLSSSGWDLAEERTHMTTGFSGTNDGRYLLPTSITQHDPEHQRGTNAKVLAHLLQPENDGYRQTSKDNGDRRTAREFLELLVAQECEIRVVLDVGAQVLELTNREFVAAWLELKSDAKAAIYFDEDDELYVLTREGKTQLLQESSFARRLDECVVYLDDAHTRGTDIKFPIGFRAAVTLGPKVTKDRLTQGCMRMRKLGHGHSVMFFAPLDVDRAIRAAASVADKGTVHALDILLWAMHETCTEIQKRAPHWAQQGTDHTSRYDAWSKFCHNEIASDELAIAWRQPDAKSLEQLYAPTRSREQGIISIPEIRQRCADLGILSLPISNMDEEQEREIVHEIERERQIERPPPAVGAKHRISDDIRHFVQTGILKPNSSAFIPIFSSFQIPNAPQTEEGPWTRRVLATSDFCKVIQGTGDVSEYLRPVSWVLSGLWLEVLIILSPYEVNELLSDIRRSEHFQLHIYTPRVHKAMTPCDDLDLYSIPAATRNSMVLPALREQLNLFAGQLYLRDYEVYFRLCRFLCIYAKDLEDEGDVRRESDGFIAPAHRPPKARSEGSFSRSPLPFLRFLIGLRRKGMPFSLTHMGKILDGRPVREEDFEVKSH